MARLQSVADAYKELENRRKGRKKKGPQPGGNKSFSVVLNFYLFISTVEMLHDSALYKFMIDIDISVVKCQL